MSGGETEHRTLRAMGLTMMGVVLSITASVGFGMSGPWWLRVGVALAVAVLLVAAIKVGTSQGARGPVTRFADWLTGESGPDSF